MNTNVISNKMSNNSPDVHAAVTDEVAAAEVVAAASATNVAGHFDPATREAKRVGSPTPATTSSAPDRRGVVVEAVVEEVEAAVAAAVDDRPAVAGSGSCYKVPAEKPRLTHDYNQSYTYTYYYIR